MSFVVKREGICPNIFEGIFESLYVGTSQGGVISPLLSNIALDGIEKRIGDWAET